MINYLYHGYLQVKIVDSNSKIAFGEGFLKTKDLVRIRRNEVTVMKDILIKKDGVTCAKLKIEVRCIRK